MDENVDAARLFACFNKLSAEQKKEIITTAESLLKRQKEDRTGSVEGEGQQEENAGGPA
jgi:hypothetical protein